MIDKARISKSAHAFAAKGQIDKAIQEWEKLLKESHDGNIYNVVGDLYLKKGYIPSAVENFTMAAAIFREEGFYLKAIALYKKILNLSPKEVDAIISLAELNAEKGLIGNANENYLVAAEIYMKDGATEKALGIYQEIVKISPSNLKIRLKIADMYLKIDLNSEATDEYQKIAGDYLEKKDYEKAQELYLRVIGIKPQNVIPYIGLSKIAENSGEIKQAYEYLNKAISITPDDSEALFNYARLSIETDNVEDAKKSLSRLVEIDPDNIKHKKLLGTIYLKEGSLEAAWKELQTYIDEILEAGKWDEALELLGNFKDIEPVSVKQRLASVYKGKGDNVAAIQELKDLAGIYEKNKLPDEALQTFKEILKLSPADEDVQVKIKELESEAGVAAGVSFEDNPVEDLLPKVDEYISGGQINEALESLEKLKSREPHNLDIRTRLKDVYVKSGNKDRAADECFAISELYEKNGDMEAKNIAIEEARAINPADARFLTAGIPSPKPEIADVPDEPEAAAAIPSEPAAAPAVELSDEKIAEELAEADFYALQGLKDEAVALYEKLLLASPGNEEISNKLKALKPEDGGQEAAETESEQTEVDSDLKDIFHEFKKGIESELGEQDSETRYNLGIAYKEMGLIEDAIREFKISLKDPEKVLRSANMLAMCYLEKKLYPLAIQEFKKVVAAVPPSDDGYLGAKCDLADAYIKNKDYVQALQLYTEIHSQDPDFRDVAKKVDIIKSMPAEEKDKPKSKKDRVSYI